MNEPQESTWYVSLLAVVISLVVVYACVWLAAIAVHLLVRVAIDGWVLLSP